MQRKNSLLSMFLMLSIMILSPTIIRADEVATFPNIEPPGIRKVVLYKHGMGYIERQGKVTDNVVLSMHFRDEQMKDLLNSFFAVDLNGGKVTSIQYETKDPISKRLQDILINVPEQAALSQFLTQLKGARISARASGETLTGRILGIEPTAEIVNGQTIKTGYRLVLLSDSGPIRSFDLMSISEFTLADESLLRDLRRLLDITLDSKYTNRKKLTLTAQGKGERELRLGYLIEMPIWKSSYRIIFDSKNREEALIQGWALAENTTEEDWKDIYISFVAGNPLSYVMDVYSPYYVTRPKVPIPGIQDLSVAWDATPPAETVPSKPKYEAVLKKRANLPKDNLYANVAQSMDSVMREEDSGAGSADERSMGELMTDSTASITQGIKVGELFSYAATERISIPRGQAAMVPFMLKTLKGERLLYYKAAFSPKPTNAFVLRNDTDLTLDAGAVTFFEGATSLGEGILGHTLPPGSQEVIPYAIDASVDVNPQVSAKKLPHFKGKIADGLLHLTRTETLQTTWKITNRGKEPATLWINQPKNPLYELSKPEKPLKEVDNHYRFEVSLTPGEVKDFVVEEKRNLDETVFLNNSDATTIRFYASEQYLSPATKNFLAELGDLMSKRASLEREISESKQQAQRIAEEEQRLRDNIYRTNTGIPKEAELRAKWMDSLDKAEGKLAKLNEKLDDADKKNREIQGTIAQKIKEFKED